MVDLQHVAMNWRAPGEHGKRGPVRCVVDVERFHEAYAAHPCYLPPERDPKWYKDTRFLRFAQNTPAEQIEAPTVFFVRNPCGVHVRFIQGRHRYRVAREAGCSEIVVVTWGRKSLWFGMTANIITRCLDHVGHIKPPRSARKQRDAA
jgi:hypothetical protein